MNTLFRKLAVAVAALAFLPAWAANPAPKVGDTFPALAVEGLEGTVPDLADKVVLIDFWASSCAPCRKSFPAISRLHEKYGSQGFVVVAVNLDDEKDEMNTFLKKVPVPFAIVRDSKSTLADKVGIAALPTTFLLDRKGRVQLTHTGYEGDKTAQGFAAKIEGLLKN